MILNSNYCTKQSSKDLKPKEPHYWKQTKKAILNKLHITGKSQKVKPAIGQEHCRLGLTALDLRKVETALGISTQSPAIKLISVWVIASHAPNNEKSRNVQKPHNSKSNPHNNSRMLILAT